MKNIHHLNLNFITYHNLIKLLPRSLLSGCHSQQSEIKGLILIRLYEIMDPLSVTYGTALLQQIGRVWYHDTMTIVKSLI